MSRSLTVGNQTFQFPEPGTKPGWGEEATCWAVAVTNTLATLSGPNDINCTCVAIANNQACAANIGVGATALNFATGSVRSFQTNYLVTRTDSFCVTTVESGTMYGAYNGSAWVFSHDHIGCAGMDFQITAAGQVQYFSDASKGTGTIKFRARTIDQ